MNTQTQFILEYGKFTSTFCLLAISACSWFFVREIEKTKELRWYHGLLALGFICALFSASTLVTLFKNVYLELSKTETEQNLISAEIKTSMNCVTNYLYATVASLGLFAFFQSICRKNIIAIVLLIFLFSSHNERALAATDEQLNWLGSTSNSAFLAIKSHAPKLAISKNVQINMLNMRSSNYPGGVEVYNATLKNWYPVNYPSSSNTKFAITNWEGFKSRALEASNCADPVKLTIILTKSTPKADLFVDTESWGQTNTYGMLKASIGSKCKGSTVSIDLKKKACEDRSSSFQIDRDPKDYNETISLKCR